MVNSNKSSCCIYRSQTTFVTRLKPSSTKILQKASQNGVRIFKNVSWNTVPLWWGTGTPFLLPKAWIPSCADPHGIIHSTSLPPGGGGSICECSSQPKLPHLEFWDSLHARRRDSPSFHHGGNVLTIECLCKDTSNVLLFLCPAQLSDALQNHSQPLPPSPANISLCSPRSVQE